MQTRTKIRHSCANPASASIPVRVGADFVAAPQDRADHIGIGQLASQAMHINLKLVAACLVIVPPRLGNQPAV